MRLKPFYQGKIDTFCAIYAVLNALRITHGIRTLKARDILNETLMGLAGDPPALRAVLEQQTDYISLVDGMLRAQQVAFPLETRKPFAAGRPVPPDELWKSCQEWMAGGTNRTIILRFTRNLVPGGPPANRHWTTVDGIDDKALHLFDCSHEAEAILHIHRNAFVTRSEEISADRLLCIQPESLRFLRLPF